MRQVLGFLMTMRTRMLAPLTTFLALAVDRCSDFNNALCRWSSSNQKVMNLFGRQAIPMVWDFAEANISVTQWVLGTLAANMLLTVWRC